MPGVGRPPVGIHLAAKASPFLALLRAVVVRLAEGLKLAFPEQGLIALMLDDVVGDGGDGGSASLQAHLAERLLAELPGSPAVGWVFPPGLIVEVAVALRLG